MARSTGARASLHSKSVPASDEVAAGRTATSASPRRKRRAGIVAGVLLSAAILVCVGYGWADLFAPGAQIAAAAPALGATVSAVEPVPAAIPVGAPALAADERSGNLQAAFSALWQSQRPLDKARAVSVWNACVPVFLGAGTQAPSLQRALAGLPSDPRYDAQRSAYADLFGRCKQFYGDDNATLAARTAVLRRASLGGDATATARQAVTTAALGDLPAARSLARAALATREPHELFELAGIASKLLEPEATPEQRAAAVLDDAAFPLAACDLGLDCSMNSLLAVKLCAFEGLCTGTVQDRLRSKYAPDAERAQVELQANRLAAAVRAGSDPARSAAAPSFGQPDVPRRP